MRVVAYTESAGIGGAEISFKHLVIAVSEKTDITVVGICQVVVDEIAHHRAQASRGMLPAKGMRSLTTHLQVLHKLRLDVGHINLLFAALTT